MVQLTDGLMGLWVYEINPVLERSVHMWPSRVDARIFRSLAMAQPLTPTWVDVQSTGNCRNMQKPVSIASTCFNNAVWNRCSQVCPPQNLGHNQSDLDWMIDLNRIFLVWQSCRCLPRGESNKIYYKSDVAVVWMLSSEIHKQRKPNSKPNESNFRIFKSFELWGGFHQVLQHRKFPSLIRCDSVTLVQHFDWWTAQRPIIFLMYGSSQIRQG